MENETSQCPRCNKDDEHTNHIFTCNGKGTTAIFNTGLAELSMWLGKTTSREMEEAVIRVIKNHRNEKQEQDWTEWNGTEDIKEALVEQGQIGAEAFLSGMVSSKWAKAQSRYHNRIGSRKREIKWTATLTAKMIDMIADLWKHRNEALHKRDNVVRQKDHDKLNDEIETCMRQLP